MKYADGTPTRLEVNSETNDWSANWTGANGVAKSFYVGAYDNDNTPISGVAITLSDDSTLAGTLLGSPVTNAAGIATCRVLLDTPAEGVTAGVVIFTATDFGSLIGSIGIGFVDETLPKVRCLVALDGVIDDNDYASGELIATLMPGDATLNTGDQALLYWGQTIVEPEEGGIEDNYFTFDMNGRNDLFQNQTLQYRGTIISINGTGSYSSTSTVTIERENGGDGFQYLTGTVSIPEATNGYINLGMSIVGVHVLIESGDIESENDELFVEDYLNNSACTVYLYMTGKDNDGNIINHLLYDVTSDPNELVESNSDGSVIIPVNDIKTTVGTDVGKNFFTNLGEGRVYLNLNVTYADTPYSLKELNIKSYVVDVVPPGV